MDNLMKLTVSIALHKGNGGFNEGDDFYINGRCRYGYESEDITLYTEKNLPEHILALCGGMERINHDKKASVSIVKELKKFQDRIQFNGGDLKSKMEELAVCVEEINNMIFSMSLGDRTNRDKASNFSALFFVDGKVAALNTSDSRIYLLRDGELKQLTGDKGKAERLLRAGIITNEQVKVLSGRLGMSGGVYTGELMKSNVLEAKEDDIFLLCSDKLGTVLGDEAINDILSCGREAEYMSHDLIKRTLNEGVQDSLAVMIVKYEGVHSDVSERSKGLDAIFNNNRDERETDAGRRHSNAWAYIAAAIVCVIVAGILVNTYFKLGFGDFGNAAENTQAYASDVTSETDMIDTAEGNDEAPSEDQEPQGETEGNNNEEEPPAGGNQDEPVVYTVQSGDSLEQISKKFYNDTQKYKLIMEKNNITDEDKLEVGQKLIIPSVEEVN